MLVFEIERITQRKAAIITGTAMFIMAIYAAIAFGGIHSSLIVNGDGAATMSNIRESISLFRAEIFCWLIILLCDITVSWSLYIYLKQVDNSLSQLGAWLRLIYSAILGIAVAKLILISLLLSEDSNLAAIPADQLQAQLMLFVNAFDNIWSMGLVIFGFHLLIIGYLILNARFIPNFLGALIIIAAFSYITTHSFHLFLPQYEKITILLENILSLPMALGELGLGLWLLIKGGKVSHTVH